MQRRRGKLEMKELGIGREQNQERPIFRHEAQSHVSKKICAHV
jgi:hypothetical protein